MRLELKDFQKTAADQVLARLRTAITEFEHSGEEQALSLSAPTGAGKTVIATAVIERLFNGDEDVPDGDEEAVILWLTDQPSLNEQTRRKMLGASDVLGPDRLITIESTFSAEELRPGNVYFLNIQKLARNQPLVNRRDGHDTTMWDTINRTAAIRRGHFILVIDEAHRGMRANAGSDDTRTIAQRFVLGFNATLKPVPIVLGISATPERFTEVVDTSDRVTRRTNVPPAEVIASGLLKTSILLRHPDEPQPGDSTMLAEAIREWQLSTGRWRAYTDAEDLPPVNPILVIQVQDARAKSSDSATDLEAVVDTLRTNVPDLATEALAHSFDLGGPLEIAGQVVRYIKPEDIQEDPDVRVVLFKTGLTTGWDCPRAEVMFSFRKAAEYVSIAQLIGRMVRTALARTIEGDDLLNTVSLYLPSYDRDAVKAVVSKLSTDPDESTPVEVIVQPVTCRRNPKVSDEVVATIEAVPTYTVPGRSKPNQVSRLMKLATLLTGDDIDNEALKKAQRRILAGGVPPLV